MSSPILVEALEGRRQRELTRTLEMIMWADAVEGFGRFPKWFPAAYHVKTAEGRSESAVSLRAYLGANPNAGEFLWRQLFAFEANPDLSELSTFVHEDLDRRLRASPPKEAAGVERRDPPQMQVFRSVAEQLTSLGVRPFLVSGTLLGLVRDGGLLAHDYDIDLGLLPGDGDPGEIARALTVAGFDVEIGEDKVVCRSESGAVVDIFLHYERDGLLWHGTDIHEWWNTPFELEPAELEGIAIWIPDDAERYLTENYGDWSRPVAFYNFSFDTPNRVYRKTPEALLYLHKRFVRALEHGDRWYAESVARELKACFGVDVTAAFNPTPLLGNA